MVIILDNIGRSEYSSDHGSTLLQLLSDKSFSGDGITDWMSSLQAPICYVDLTINKKMFKNLVLNIIVMKNFEFKGCMKFAMPAIQEKLVTFKPDTRIYL
jgi:hypothetical protein